MIDTDLAQLFRRLAFKVLTSHRDDHLRNHGFLRGRDGWRLAPAFDLNPVPGKPGHELSLDGHDSTGDLGVVRTTAPFYRLSERAADGIVAEVTAAVSDWRGVAARSSLGSREMGLLEEAILV